MAKSVESVQVGESTVKVGDIFYSSWGYDQTNIDFYQIVRLTEKGSAFVRPIRARRVETENGHFTQEALVPVKDGFFEGYSSHIKSEGAMKRLRAGYRGQVTFSLSTYAGAYPYEDGRVLYQTAAGFGH